MTLDQKIQAVIAAATVLGVAYMFIDKLLLGVRGKFKRELNEQKRKLAILRDDQRKVESKLSIAVFNLRSLKGFTKMPDKLWRE